MFEAKYSLLQPNAIRQRIDASSEQQARQLAREFAHTRRDGHDGILVLTGLVEHTTGRAIPVEHSTQPPPDGYVDVHWAVRVRADSAEAGAAFARAMQFDPSSLASVYRCCDSLGAVEIVDLQGAASSPH